MTDPGGAGVSPQEAALQREVARLNKMVTALMNRAEREMSAKVSDFSAFESGVALENQVRERTQQLEAALRENERFNQALQKKKKSSASSS